MGAVLAALVLALAEAAQGRIGDLAFDPTLWRATAQADGAYQIGRADGRALDAPITVRLTDEAPDACTLESLAAAPLEATSAGQAPGAALRRSGLQLLYSRRFSGCRNARPPTVRACIVLKGRVYRLDSPAFGCAGGPGFRDDAMTFLQGLSAAEP